MISASPAIGTCPPHGDKPHRYHFRLSALSEPSFPVGPSATCVDVIALASPYILEFVELVGYYRRDEAYLKGGG